MAEVTVVCMTEDNPLQNKSNSTNARYGTFLPLLGIAMETVFVGLFFDILWTVTMNELA